MVAVVVVSVTMEEMVVLEVAVTVGQEALVTPRPQPHLKGIMVEIRLAEVVVVVVVRLERVETLLLLGQQETAGTERYPLFLVFQPLMLVVAVVVMAQAQEKWLEQEAQVAVVTALLEVLLLNQQG
jgi:hypothetical protein